MTTDVALRALRDQFALEADASTGEWSRAHRAAADALTRLIDPPFDPTAPRTYCIGLPVLITIHPNGHVTATPDLSEIADIAEGQPLTDDLQPIYPTDVVDADVALVSNPNLTVEVLP